MVQLQPSDFFSASLLRTGQAWLLAALMALASTCVTAQGAVIYRYEDENGRMVFNSVIPAQFVRKGYTVLNDKGRVIREVPPTASPAEIAARQAAGEDVAVISEAQQEADRLLLQLYRDPAEIARKRDERVRQLEGQLAGLSLNINNLDKDIEALEKQLAASATPPPNVQNELDSKLAQRERLTTQQTRMEAEKETVVEQATRDMNRLRELLGLPEETAAE